MIGLISRVWRRLAAGWLALAETFEIPEHGPDCEGICGGQFRCAGCRKLFGECERYRDATPELCAVCWVKVTPVNAQGWDDMIARMREWN